MKIYQDQLFEIKSQEVLEQNLKMADSEQLCLQWNDFQTNISSSFKDLRNDQDFTDVTLVCGENHRIEAHKVVLASASEVFKNILKGNKHPHPLIYMRGIDAGNFASIIDFVYHGETNVFQNNLESFLLLATELDLKGLAQNQEGPHFQHIEEAILRPSTKPKKKPKNEQTVSKTLVKKEEDSIIPIETTVSNIDEPIIVEAKTSISFNDHGELDKKIDTMLDKFDGFWTCSVCGKTDKNNRKDNLRKHIETHIEGVSHPCGHCGRIFRSRNSLQGHISTTHKN